MRKTPPSPSDEALERLRIICQTLPGVEEKLSHGAPSFHVRGRMLAMFMDNHHADGLIAVWCKSTHDEQRARVASDAERFFVPPYVGVKGWVGVRLDLATTDWIDLSILLEEGWTEIAPKGIGRNAGASPPKLRAPPPVRQTTDAGVARETLDRVTTICLAFPEAICERESQHATFRVRKKTFAYFLDNHHGDGIIGLCVKVPSDRHGSLLTSNPKRFYSPAYIGPRGWIGIRVDVARVDWRDVRERVGVSYRRTAPKRLVAQSAQVTARSPGPGDRERPPRSSQARKEARSRPSRTRDSRAR
jgi:hypothetical protein